MYATVLLGPGMLCGISLFLPSICMCLPCVPLTTGPGMHTSRPCIFLGIDTNLVYIAVTCNIDFYSRACAVIHIQEGGHIPIVGQRGRQAHHPNHGLARLHLRKDRWSEIIT